MKQFWVNSGQDELYVDKNEDASKIQDISSKYLDAIIRL